MPFLVKPTSATLLKDHDLLGKQVSSFLFRTLMLCFKSVQKNTKVKFVRAVASIQLGTNS